jgi:hypothetical protein
MQIQYGAEIQPALGLLDVDDIGDPHGVWQLGT